MPLPTFKTADEVPEAFRGEYEERDGEWRPKAEAALQGEAEKRAQLLNEKKEEERRRIAAEKALDDLKRSEDRKKKGISEEDLQRIRDEEAAARKPIEEERDRLAAENRKLKLTDKVQVLALKHGIMEDRIEDAMLVLDRRADLGDEGGVVFKDKEGKVTADSPEAFFEKFKAEKPWLFRGSGASGSGARGSDGSGEDPSPSRKTEPAEHHQQAVRGAF